MEVIHEFGEMALRILEKNLRVIEFGNFTIAHNHDLVTFDNCLKSMGNCNHGAVFELFIDELLDHLLSLNIDVGCCFIEEDDLIFPENGSADLNERLFARGKIVIDLKVEEGFILCKLF